jgi:hypothetical protein
VRNLRVGSEQSRIFESRAKRGALNKVPHLQSSPFGRGEEGSTGYAQFALREEKQIQAGRLQLSGMAVALVFTQET